MKSEDKVFNISDALQKEEFLEIANFVLGELTDVFQRCCLRYTMSLNDVRSMVISQLLKGDLNAHNNLGIGDERRSLWEHHVKMLYEEIKNE